MRYDWHVDNKARRTLETRLREHGQAVTGQNKQTMSNTRNMSFTKLHLDIFEEHAEPPLYAWLDAVSLDISWRSCPSPCWSPF